LLSLIEEWETARLEEMKVNNTLLLAGGGTDAPPSPHAPNPNGVKKVGRGKSATPQCKGQKMPSSLLFRQMARATRGRWAADWPC